MTKYYCSTINCSRWALVAQPSTFQLTSIPYEVPSDAKVSLLIDPHTKAWRVDTIRRYFSSVDASAILSIPLSSRLAAVRLVWAYNPKGLFTVKNEYKVALTRTLVRDSGEASSNQNNKLFWRTIWEA